MFQGGFGSSQAGGGFGDAGGFNTSGASPGASKAQNNRPESLSPVTNCMIRRAVHNADKDMFVFKENIDLHLVEMVGYIMDITEGSTCYEYHICDRTAPEPLYIRKFLNDNDRFPTSRLAIFQPLKPQPQDASALPRSNCYVRVVGHLRFVKEQPSIMAFSIKEIKSHNEFLLHRLSVVRFMCGKELAPKLGSKLASSGGVPSSGTFNNNGGAAQSDGGSMPGMTMTQTKFGSHSGGIVLKTVHYWGGLPSYDYSSHAPRKRGLLRFQQTRWATSVIPSKTNQQITTLILV
eukprot:sb/3467606/